MAAGRPRRFLPPCAMTGSMRPACSTAPSTANASAPMSNSSSPRPSSRATSLSSTISAPTRERRCDKPSEPSGRASFPAQILARPQPDRAGVRQVQDFAAKGRSPNIRRRRKRKRSHPRSIPTRRMRRLCQERRIRVNPNAEGSRRDSWATRPWVCEWRAKLRPCRRGSNCALSRAHWRRCSR